MDSLEKLQHPSFPLHGTFFSSLANTNISTEEYQYCQKVWSSNNMQSFRDFLIWYNNLDVRCSFSIPGITLTYLFTTLEPDIFFSLFTLLKSHMVGCPSIIFHQYHEKDKTLTCEQAMKNQGKQLNVCKKILGYHANALYLWAIMQDMPTGSFTRRREKTGFKKESSVRMVTGWLEWEAK